MIIFIDTKAMQGKGLVHASWDNKSPTVGEIETCDKLYDDAMDAIVEMSEVEARNMSKQDIDKSIDRLLELRKLIK